MEDLVNSRNFHETMLQHNKLRPDDYVIIRQKNCYPTRDEQEIGDQAAELWFLYLSSKGFRRTISCWKSILRSGGKSCVMAPCLDPATFDTQWRRVSRSDLRISESFFRDEFDPPDEYARARMAQAHEAFLRETHAKQRSVHPKRSPQFSKQDAENWLAEFTEPAPLPPLSDRARQILARQSGEAA